MIIDQTLDRKIGQLLLKENEAKRKEHKSSGKLSASMLHWPLQHIILKLKGIDPDPLNEYVIRKFKRGDDIEKWLVNNMEGVKEKQMKVEYRNAIGFADALVDSSYYEYKNGLIPHEIKSVSNAKFRRIITEGKMDTSHALQACFYALALHVSDFCIDYVASDDLRVHSMIDDVSNWKQLVDERISEVERQLESGIVPVFSPRESWQENIKYNSYSEWAELTQEEIDKKLKEIGKL